MTPKHPPGPPMDLANMRAQGVHHLIAFCLNDACRHQARARQSRTGGRWCAQRVGTCPPGRLGIGINGPLLRLFPEMAAYAGCRRGLSTSGEPRPRWGPRMLGWHRRLGISVATSCRDSRLRTLGTWGFTSCLETSHVVAERLLCHVQRLRAPGVRRIGIKTKNSAAPAATRLAKG
jgi:hypothetical protein